jgi:hypothetical protein
MKNQRQDLQRQLADLIPIIELCIPIIKDTNETKIKLLSLSIEIEKLKERAEKLQIKSSLEDNEKLASRSTNAQLETTEFAIDSLVDDLEEVFAYLTSQNHKLNNFLALKERFEAVQEERIDGITPERIYNLLEKKQLQQERDRDTKPIKANPVQQLWQKTAKTTAIATVVILTFSTIFYSLIKYQFTEESAIRENKGLNTNND